MAGIISAITSGGGTGGINTGVRDAAGEIERGRKDIKQYTQEGQEFLEPWANLSEGLPGLQDKIAGGFSFDDFKADPGYQFALEQGLGAVQNQGGLRGSPFGGNTMAAQQQFATGLADQTYNQAYERKFKTWQQEVGDMKDMAGLGFQAASGQAGLAGQAGGSLADMLSNLAGIRAQGGIAGAQTQTGLLSSILG